MSAHILQETFGYKFSDPMLLACALTHKSARKKDSIEHGINNERLEFLGDAVLSLVAANFLYTQKPHFTEGDLSRLRAQYVCQENLSKAAVKLIWLRISKVIVPCGLLLFYLTLWKLYLGLFT